MGKHQGLEEQKRGPKLQEDDTVELNYREKVDAEKGEGDKGMGFENMQTPILLLCQPLVAWLLCQLGPSPW